MRYQESITEAAWRYLSRQPVHTLITGRPLYEHNQMIRAFCAGHLAVIEGDTTPPASHMVGDCILKNALEMTGCENEENLIDMANVGNSLTERIDSLVSQPGAYHRWSPADDPAEIIFDLVNDLDELRDVNVKLREALGKIAVMSGLALDIRALTTEVIG